MSAAPVQLADYEALVLDDSLARVGIARAAMDVAVFQYSPAGRGEAVRQRTIDGRLFINVAAPQAQAALDQFTAFFKRIRLKMNGAKTKVLVSDPGRIRHGLSSPTYKRQMTGRGQSEW